jgi:hypothetical protein
VSAVPQGLTHRTYSAMRCASTGRFGAAYGLSSTRNIGGLTRGVGLLRMVDQGPEYNSGPCKLGAIPACTQVPWAGVLKVSKRNKVR